MGVAFPSVLNLPLHRIDSVDVRVTGKDREGREVGDLVLTPAGERAGRLAVPLASREALGLA
jgi:hypothetical protein